MIKLAVGLTGRATVVEWSSRYRMTTTQELAFIGLAILLVITGTFQSSHDDGDSDSASGDHEDTYV
jgi:hypothetical protein